MVTYTEKEHPHQSEMVDFVPHDYVPYQVDEEGQKIYGVVSLVEGELAIIYQKELPAFGGYLNREMIYGSPKYCTEATKNHRKHRNIYGEMPHLVFFDARETAESLGFRRCKRCYNEANPSEYKDHSEDNYG